MATGFEKLQKALDLYKFEDAFETKKTSVLKKLGINKEQVFAQINEIETALDVLGKVISSKNLDELKANVALDKSKDFFTLKMGLTQAEITDITTHNLDGFVVVDAPDDASVRNVRERAETYKRALIDSVLDAIHSKNENFKKEHKEEFKKNSKYDIVALYNLSKKDPDQMPNLDELNKSWGKMTDEVVQLEAFKKFLINKNNYQEEKHQKQAAEELKLIQSHLDQCKRELLKIEDVKEKVNAAEFGNDYISLGNGMTYSIQTKDKLIKYVTDIEDVGVKTLFSLGSPDGKKTGYIQVPERASDQIGIFKKNYKAPGQNNVVEESHFTLKGDANNPKWKSEKAPDQEDEARLAAHAMEWAILIVRQNLPTPGKPFYVEEGSQNPKEAKFLVVALLKVLKITSREEANALIKTDTDWKPADELSYFGTGFGIGSIYNNVFKDNSEVKSILTTYKQRHAVEEEYEVREELLPVKDPDIKEKMDSLKATNAKNRIDSIEGNDSDSEYESDSDSEYDPDIRPRGTFNNF